MNSLLLVFVLFTSHHFLMLKCVNPASFISSRLRSVVPHWSPGFRVSVRSSLIYVTSFPDLLTWTMNWTPSAQSDVMQIHWPLRLIRYRAFYPV